MKHLSVAAILLCLCCTALADTVQDISVRSLSGETKDLHEVIRRQEGVVLGIVLSDDQDIGQQQLEDLVAVSQRLDLETSSVQHLNIIAGAPRFVHGLIRRGFNNQYDDRVPPEHVWLGFIGDLDMFASSLQLPVDQRANWVALDTDGQVVWAIKQDSVEEVAHFIECYLSGKNSEKC